MQQLGYTRDFNLGALPEDDQIRAGAVMPNQGGSRVIPQFFTMEERDVARSTALGRTVHRSIEMVRIIIPGDKHNIVERRVTDEDRARFSRAYEAFKRDEEFVPDGTRLESWGILTRAQVLDLKAANIWTVEQIADLSDEKLPALGLGARKLRDHAKAFLETTKKGALPAQLVEENNALKEKVNLLMEQMAQMATRFEDMARKAGERVDNVANPITEVLATASKVHGVDMAIDVPKDYVKLGFGKLKELAGKISSAPVVTREDALEIIAEFVGKKSALKA